MDTHLALPIILRPNLMGRLRAWLAKNQSEQATYRRHDDRTLRRVMVWSAVVSGLVNGALAYVVFKMDLLHPLFRMMETYSQIEDRVAVFGFGVLFTLLFLTTFYTSRVSKLLKDVNRLAVERDHAIEKKNQRERLESLGVIAAGISHEINSSLQVILTSCELAKARIGNADESLKMIERAIENGLHAKRVTSNVLMFSKDGGALSLKRAPTRELLDEAMEFSRAFLPQTVAVNLRLENEKGRVVADRAAFIQVVNNVVSNAAHAIGFLGVVEVNCKEVDVYVDGALTLDVPTGKYLRIDVVDHGKGMSPEQMARVFDPFFTTKRADEGTGLGLSIVHGLMRRMNGAITVTSELGKGSTFSLWLPVAREN